MNIDDLGFEAGRELDRASQSLKRPSLEAITKNRRKRAGIGTAFVLATAALLVVTISVVSPSDGDAVSGTTSPPPPTTVPESRTTVPDTSSTGELIEWPPGWSRTPSHAAAGRTFPSIVWTGTEYIIWGGEKPSEGEWHKTGAAFDPSRGAWRDLAPGPLAPRSEHVAVWTGTEVIICCGRQEGAGESAAAYNPSTDSWRSIATPPLSPDFAEFSPAFAEAVWSGAEMIVFGGVSGGGNANLRRAAAYDPVADTWRTLADLPYGIERQADAVLGDGVIYAWPSLLRAGEPAVPLTYDIATDSWQTLPVPESLDLPLSPSLVWTGRELVAWGLAPSFEADRGIGLSFDPGTGTWSPLPPAPLQPTSPSEGSEGSQAAAWTGSEVILWTGWIGTEWDAPTTSVLTYTPATDSWSALEPAPIESAGLWHDPLIWTGTQLLVHAVGSDAVLVFTPDASERDPSPRWWRITPTPAPSSARRRGLCCCSTTASMGSPPSIPIAVSFPAAPSTASAPVTSNTR